MGQDVDPATTEYSGGFIAHVFRAAAHIVPKSNVLIVV
jgi:hypothetical protein